MTGQTITFFTAGACFMYLLLEGIFILRYKQPSRIQKILGYMSLYFAVWTFKDLFICFDGNESSFLEELVAYLDGFSVLAYTALLIEVPKRGFVTTRRLAIGTLPFIAFSVAHIIHPSDILFKSYIVFLFVGGWIIMISSIIMSVRYFNYIRQNYSNIDDLDISWLKPFFALLITMEMVWICDAVWPSPVFDTIYYIVFAGSWFATINLGIDTKDIKVEEEPQTEEPITYYPFAGKLESVITKQKLYKNRELTLQDLTINLCTNRTYLSSYFKDVLNTNFYDYINKLRIELSAIPLLESNDNMTIEAIAYESGFNSISTFRRAFVKITGETPRNYKIKHSSQES